MNEIQIKTFTYLSDGGSRDERNAALRQLTEDGFFQPLSIEDAEDHLRDFVRQMRREESFCNGGIDRFEQAILGSLSPRTVSVWLKVDLVDVTNDAETVSGQLSSAVSLLRASNWRVDTVDVSDYETD